MGSDVQFRDALVQLGDGKAWLEVKSWSKFNPDAYDRLRKQAKSHFKRIADNGTDTDFRTVLRYEFDASVIGNVTKLDIINALKAKNGLREIFELYQKTNKITETSFGAWFNKFIDVQII